ncbi:Uncharacterised protein [Mycobacteroides abscessus subsp. abscessus]|nr:Uncharacterised protein [Mycobacteroides abscessus subsp. abscessus]SIK91663.1 Uncharacterised protein [Mycobacteroides abscessus subsp. abscessus]SIL98944.1 Uncharacterised protein [Mycobacteroides abscessus subsp. abscessus]SLE80855.1 Uncharacterised protein [Mycobacteroides abscessus subsp. abscessus]
MFDAESPLSPVERLLVVSLYVCLSQSQNRSVAGRLDSERSCYADLNIYRPETLSDKRIPAIRLVDGFRTGVESKARRACAEQTETPC